jgi:hypothetical protein
MRLPHALLLSASLFAADLKKDLTFHATFDGSTDAAVAKGDKRLFHAANYKAQAEARPGLPADGLKLVPTGQGKKGGALHFTKKNTQAIFYQGAGNVAFDAKAWTGTIAFWLSLDPETDLEPGYCDPIQVTDKSFDDSAIWVDFTKDDKPRHFRLGIFGAKSEWNPQNVAADKNEKFLGRLVVEKKYPFAKGQWTHVAITHEKLGSGAGRAKLYLNGKLVGETPAIEEAFAWDMKNAAIRLGVNYTGLFDELAIFSRALSAGEVRQIASGKF